MLTTNQMYSTKITNIKKNYYGLLSIDDDDDTDDITIVTSNKSTNSKKHPKHKPANTRMQNHIQICATSINLPTKAKAWRHIIHNNNKMDHTQTQLSILTISTCAATVDMTCPVGTQAPHAQTKHTTPTQRCD